LKLEPWPVALTTSFYEDAARDEQWRRFLQRTKLAVDAPGGFELVGERIRAFLDPPLRATQRTFSGGLIRIQSGRDRRSTARHVKRLAAARY